MRSRARRAALASKGARSTVTSAEKDVARTSAEAPARSLFEHPYRLAAKILATYALLWVLLVQLAPLLGASLARGARNWVLATSWIPYLIELSWTESGYLAHDLLLPIGRVIATPTLLFAFLFPVGLAIALPAQSRGDWILRLTTTLVVSYAVCSMLLAIVIEQELIEGLAEFGVTIHEPPRPALIRAASRYVWDFSEVVYPVVMSVWIGRSALLRQPAEQGEGGRFGTTTGWKGALVALAVILVGLGGLELRARRAHAATLSDSHSTSIRKLAALNPEFGTSLMRIGEMYMEFQQYGLAYQMFERALGYPGSEILARDGMRRARGKGRKTRVRRQQRGQLAD